MLIMKLTNISPYSIVYYALRVAGVINNGSPLASIYSAVHVISLTAFGTFGVLEVILEDGGLNKLILALSSLVIFIQVYYKQIKMLLNEKRILEFLDRLSKYRAELLDEEDHRSQVLIADYLCRKYVIYFNCVFLSFPIVSFVSNFITDYFSHFENPHLIMQLWIPWKLNSIWPYLAGTIFILMVTLTAVFVYGSFAMFQFIFTFQMSAYLKSLRNRLEKNGPGDSMVYYHHKKIMGLLKGYNELFSSLMYVEILVGSLEPCGFGYAFMKGLKKNEGGALDLFYKVFLCLAGPFIVCLCGQVISTQMENLHTSAYMNNWYEEKPIIRRDLFTMMEVTVRPMSMNYGLFATFDFKCFTTIMQGIYSYLMMIHKFESNDDKT